MEKKIVIADDFRSVRAFLRTTLEKKGYTVLEGADGSEALQFFNGANIDLLISDYDMPNMNGAELIREVRKKSKYQDIPIIVLTTNKMEKKADEVKDLKIDAWITKPFDIVTFYGKIAGFLVS